MRIETWAIKLFRAHRQKSAAAVVDRSIDRPSLSLETKHIIFIDRTKDEPSDRCASEQLDDITLNYKITGQPTSIDWSCCAVRHLFTKSIYKSSPPLIAATIPILHIYGVFCTALRLTQIILQQNVYFN